MSVTSDPQIDAAPGPVSVFDAPVDGMTCAGCVARVEKALAEVRGLRSASVNLMTRRVRIESEADRPATIADTVAAIERAGYNVPTHKRQIFMEGPGDGQRLELELAAIAGVLDAKFDSESKAATLRALPGAAPDEALAKAARRAAFRIRSGDDGAVEHDAEHARRIEAQRAKWERARLVFCAVLTAPLVARMAAMPLDLPFHLTPFMELALAAPVQLIGGQPFYVAAFRAIRRFHGNMDLLVALGSTAAFGFSLWKALAVGAGASGALYFEASAAIVTLVLLGRWLESRAKRATLTEIQALMDLRPQTANLMKDGFEKTVPIADVLTGDEVAVRPGETIPVDGVIVAGASAVDESLVTGENMPIAKGPGAQAIGGSVNGDGALTVRATSVGQDSTLSKIVKLVELAQTGKAPVQRLVDRISAVFVPMVLSIAAGAFFIAWFEIGLVEDALVSAVAVLVVACPCALGLATPTAIVAGMGAAARRGVLFRDVVSLEKAWRIDIAAFDKTGTLTSGKFSVESVEPEPGMSAEEMLAIADAAERGSEHPLARPIMAEAQARGVAGKAKATDIAAVPGLGLTAKIGGRQAFLGTRRFLASAGFQTHDDDCSAPDDAQTSIHVAIGRTYVGKIRLSDAVRPEAAEGVSALAKQDIDVRILSGDMSGAVALAAYALGVEHYEGELQPSQKASRIQALKDGGKRIVAMIGDGVNDAPALAMADVGFAVGSGADVAIGAAGVTLMRPDPRLVACAIEISRRTVVKIRQNLFWAFAYNVVLIPVAALGHLSPTLAGAAMAFSSTSVAINSLLLRRAKV